MRPSVAIACALAIGGCTQTERHEATEKADRIRIAGTITLPTPTGPASVPLSLTIDRSGTETTEAREKTGIDGQAIGQAIGDAAATAIRSAVAAAAGPAGGAGWDMAAGIGGALIAASTGYLALKKREQIITQKKGEK